MEKAFSSFYHTDCQKNYRIFILYLSKQSSSNIEQEDEEGARLEYLSSKKLCTGADVIFQSQVKILKDIAVEFPRGESHVTKPNP